MTTQSKSVLVPFLLVAAIIFAVALVWKLVATDETTPAVEQGAAVVTPEVKQVQPAAPAEVEIVDYDKPSNSNLNIDPEMLTEEDKALMQEQAKVKMAFAMRYPNAKKAIEDLKFFRENGNDKQAEDLITFINSVFPNESIPADLLD